PWCGRLGGRARHAGAPRHGDGGAPDRPRAPVAADRDVAGRVSTPAWTLRSVTEEFLAVEREMGLLEGPLGPLWEAARFKIQQRLVVLLGATEERQTKYLSVRPSFAGRVWDSLRNSLARPSLASGRADFLFAAHPRRRRTADGRW